MTIRTTTVAAAAVLAFAAGSTAAVAAEKGAQFGYHKVREGIPKHTPTFVLSSPELADGTFPAAAYANGFGCTGGNVAPTLTWSGAPAGTQSFAVTMFDPDAPTGSGFWHWVGWNIPASTTTLTGGTVGGMVQGTDDAGVTGYLGPCPPPGDKAHHYTIRVLALDVADLGLPASASPAVDAFTMGGHILAYGELTALASN